MKDRLFQIWFSLRCGVANREFVSLLEQHGSPYAIFSMEDAELERLSCSDKLKRAFADKALQNSYRILNYCESNQVEIVFWSDDAYPASLRSLQDPPALLYVKGNLPDLSRSLCISVVGTRRMSEYGKQMAYKIGYELAAAGAVVVSGMALGVDSVAAAGALAAQGKTIAVLGCGIDVVYPAQHATLGRNIVQNGAVITEFPPGARPEGYHFPIRNRIISGLGQGTLVVEAAPKSGALITAKTATLQGRDIYAIPGNVGSENTSGTNQLIRDGATVVLKARDILENYTFLYRDTLNMTALLVAEGRSELDNEWLIHLGVCSRQTGTALSRLEREKSSVSDMPTRPRRERAPSVKPPPVPQNSGNTEKPQRSRKPVETIRSVNVEATLDGLNDKQKRLFEMLPLDRSVSLDELTRERDGQSLSVGEVLSAMTVLEIKGLVQSLPGGMYVRK